MNKQKIQAITRGLGIACLFLAIIGQVFKSQNIVPQSYVSYLAILSLVLLSVSLYLKAKSGGFSQYPYPIKTILIFIVVVVVGISLINYLTTL